MILLRSWYSARCVTQHRNLINGTNNDVVVPLILRKAKACDTVSQDTTEMASMTSTTGLFPSTTFTSTARSPTTSILTRFTTPADCRKTWFTISTSPTGSLVSAYFEIYGPSCQLKTLAVSGTQQIPVVRSLEIVHMQFRCTMMWGLTGIHC